MAEGYDAIGCEGVFVVAAYWIADAAVGEEAGAVEFAPGGGVDGCVGQEGFHAVVVASYGAVGGGACREPPVVFID